MSMLLQTALAAETHNNNNNNNNNKVSLTPKDKVMMAYVGSEGKDKHFLPRNCIELRSSLPPEVGEYFRTLWKTYYVGCV
jgi:hypothetical protein